MSTETPSSRFAQRLQASWLVRDALARFLLPLAVLYGAVHHLRRFAYRVGLFRSQRLPVPVIVVGNMIVGGAGKTPTVLALVDALRRQGRRPGIVSRG